MAVSWSCGDQAMKCFPTPWSVPDQAAPAISEQNHHPDRGGTASLSASRRLPDAHAGDRSADRMTAATLADRRRPHGLPCPASARLSGMRLVWPGHSWSWLSWRWGQSTLRAQRAADRRLPHEAVASDSTDRARPQMVHRPNVWSTMIALRTASTAAITRSVSRMSSVATHSTHRSRCWRSSPAILPASVAGGGIDASVRTGLLPARQAGRDRWSDGTST